MQVTEYIEPFAKKQQEVVKPLAGSAFLNTFFETPYPQVRPRAG